MRMTRSSGVHRTAFRVAREHWPEEWTKLEPRLVTLASWVGYDQDGRTDMTWTRTIAARLADKLAMIERYRGKVEALKPRRSAISAHALEPLDAMLALRSVTVAHQIELLAAAERDPARRRPSAARWCGAREGDGRDGGDVALIEAALRSGA